MKKDEKGKKKGKRKEKEMIGKVNINEINLYTKNKKNEIGI